MQERILETADRLFYGQGIRAVGVDTIAAEIGISKRTLYNYFPSKDELIVAYLSRRLRPAPPSDLPPVQQILGNFERLERTFATGVFRGCPFVNAVAELKEPAHAANKIAFAFKEQRRCGFATCWRALAWTIPTRWRCSCRSWPTARSRPRWCAAIPRSPSRQAMPRGFC